MLMISACVFNSIAGIAQAPVPEVNIIPKPASIRPGTGEFRITGKTLVEYNAPELKSMADHAAGTIKWITGNDLQTKNITGTSPGRRAVSLILGAGLQIPAEGYNLSVTDGGIPSFRDVRVRSPRSLRTSALYFTSSARMLSLHACATAGASSSALRRSGRRE